MSCCEDSGSCCANEKTVLSNGENQKRVEVSQYYSALKGTSDLNTQACCTTTKSSSKKQKQILGKIHEEILSKFYGCGTPIPDLSPGLVVLDLGCGTGRDVYLASAFVGETGKVIGVDMTDSQLAVATKHREYHAKQFGYQSSNVEFKKGIIEDLSASGIASNSVDVVISNCVVNLSPEKEKVFKEIYRVLKPGGELYFSDVYADRRIPEAYKNDKMLWGECLSGAMYTEDFRRLMANIGFLDVRVVESSVVAISNSEVAKKVGSIQFYSNTVRAFKLSSLEDRCEEYGQEATYKGTMEEHPHAFVLDKSHIFVTDMTVPVCGNTADMLSLTRYAPHFVVTPRKQHLGLFGSATSSSSSCGDCGGCC